MDKPMKISYEDLVKTITMFWVDKNLEDSMNAQVENFVAEIQNKLTKIGTSEGLMDYIKADKDSLTNVLGLMDISEEKFKRIISMLRRDRRFVFSTEWSLDKTRSVLIENDSFMDDVCELLLNGASSERYKRKIPDFYRDSFKIDEGVMSRLTNRDELARLAKSKLDVKYNNSVANLVTRKIEDAIKLTCDLEGLTYAKSKNVTGIDKSYSFIIPNEKQPRILIDCSYNITTSSTQSKYAEKVAATKSAVASCSNKMVIVNILEGAGWIGRQSDLRSIYDNSDYVLNLANIGVLDQIIRYGMED